MKKILSFISCLLLIAFLLNNSSCGYDYFEKVDILIPDTVSFSNDIVPIFDASCSTSGCHVSGGFPPNLTASNAWFELWIYGYVDTTDATGSILYEVMNSETEPMPPNGKLTDDKIQLVLAWIEQGGLDN